MLGLAWRLGLEMGAADQKGITQDGQLTNGKATGIVQGRVVQQQQANGNVASQTPGSGAVVDARMPAWLARGHGAAFLAADSTPLL